MPLVVTLTRFIAAVNTADCAGPDECDVGPDMRIEVETFLIQFYVVVYGIVGFDQHFSKVTKHEGRIPCVVSQSSLQSRDHKITEHLE